MDNGGFNNTNEIAAVLEKALNGSATNDFNRKELLALKVSIAILRENDTNIIFNKIRAEK